MGQRDSILDLTVVDQRTKALRDWLEENGPQCFDEQKHLHEGTPERLYWHYGYMVALKDVLRYLTGEKLTDNPPDTCKSHRVA